MMGKKSRLRTKLTIWFLVIAILPMVVSAFIAKEVAGRYFFKEFRQRLLDVSKGVSLEIEDLKTRLQTSAKRHRKEWFLTKTLMGKNVSDLQKLIGSFKSFAPDLELSVYDLDHNLLGSSLVVERVRTGVSAKDQKTEQGTDGGGELSIDLSGWEAIEETKSKKEDGGLDIDISQFKEVDAESLKHLRHQVNLPKGFEQEKKLPEGIGQQLMKQDIVFRIVLVPKRGFKLSVYTPIIDTIYKKKWGTLKESLYIDHAFLNRIKQRTGVEMALRGIDGRLLSSTIDSVQASHDVQIQKLVKHQQPVVLSKIRIKDESFQTLFLPMTSDYRGVVGAVVLYATERFYREGVRQANMAIGSVGLFAVFVVIVLSLWIARDIANPIVALSKITRRVATGELDHKGAMPQADYVEVNELSASFSRMTHDLKKSRDELVSAKDYVDNIIRSMVDTLVVITPEGRIRNVNPATLLLLGYREDELVGQKEQILFPRGEGGKEGRLRELMPQESFSDLDVVYRTKDGETIPMSLSGAVMADKNDEVQGLVCVAKDMREYIRLTEEAKRAVAEATAAEKARLDTELATAKLVQQTLLPQQLPELKQIAMCGFYHPAAECGGDWWGYFQLKDHLVIMIGDVTGHGAGAALITAAVQSAVLTISHFQKGPSEKFSPAMFISALNRTIFETTKGENYMTFFCASVHLPTGYVRYSNAGHNFPWIYRKSIADEKSQASPREIIQSLVLRGHHVGKLRDVGFVDQHAKLNPGDKMLLYTDGIPEQVNEQGQAYGNMRLFQSFLQHAQSRVHDAKEALIADVNKFKGSQGLQDDWTMVLVEYLSTPQ